MAATREAISDRHPNMRVACVSARGGRRRPGPPDGAPWRRPPCAHTGLSDIHRLPVCIVYSVKKPVEEMLRSLWSFFYSSWGRGACWWRGAAAGGTASSRSRAGPASRRQLYTSLSIAKTNKSKFGARAPRRPARAPRPRPPRAARARGRVISMHRGGMRCVYTS